MSTKKNETDEAKSETKAAPEKTEAELVAEARAARGANSEVAPGSIVNGRPDRVYALFITREYPPAQAEALRKQWARLGYSPATNGELLVGEPDAEVWSAPKAIGDDTWKDEFLANLLNHAWLNLQTRRPNHGIAKRIVEGALKCHDGKATPDARAAAKKALEVLVRSTPIADLQTRS